MSLSFFVYGTLMSGQAAASMLDDVPGVVRHHAQLLHSGSVLCLPGHDGYPAIVRHTVGPERRTDELESFRNGVAYTIYSESIMGEVVTVPDEHSEEVLAALDRYEGYPHLYQRTRMVVYTAERRYEAQVYYMPFNYERMQNFSVVRTGNWRNLEDPVPFAEVMERGAPVQAAPAGRLDQAVRQMRDRMVRFDFEPEPELDVDDEDYDDDEDEVNFG